MTDASKECSISITDMNWMREVCIKVKAVPDGLKDRDQHVTTTLWVWFVANELTQVDNATVRVSSLLSFAVCPKNASLQ